MNWRSEFPDFPDDAIPEIPPTFEDNSWHNDACPNFWSSALDITIWIDHPEASERSNPEDTRFQICSTAAVEGEQGETLWAGDDWQECLAWILARAFSLELADTLDESTRLQVRELLKLPEFIGTGNCPTHDFCDANMIMDAAFERAFGRGARIEDLPDGTEHPDVALWNAAWERGVALWVSDPAPPAMDQVAQVIAALMDELEVAASTFENYAKNHRAKGTPEGDAKAQVNSAAAERIRRVITDANAVIAQIK